MTVPPRPGPLPPRDLPPGDLPPDDLLPGSRHRRGPGSGLDPMPGTRPPAPVGDVPPGPGPSDIPERPGAPTPRGPGTGLLALVATGRDDGRRHVVDVVPGEAGDPAGLRGRCGAAVVAVVPGPGAIAADCPSCLVTVGVRASVDPGPVDPGPVDPGPVV